MHKPAIVPNTPTNNAMLLEVKHLVLIQPLVAPDGLPETEGDLRHTKLRSDGSLAVIKVSLANTNLPTFTSTFPNATHSPSQ